MERRNMDYITPGKMREVGRRVQEEFGIPATILMENAGRVVFQAAIEMQSDKREKNNCCMRKR
jgi:NAD(P)H-hydrate repair Nnr-like enzyme with NAD(P)H-hydrate epimerase domain